MRVLERLEALKLLRCFLLLYKEEEGGQEDRALCLPASAAASSSSTATFLMSLVAVCAHAGGEQGGGGPVEDGDFRKLCLETLRYVWVECTCPCTRESCPFLQSYVPPPPSRSHTPTNHKTHDREAAVAHPSLLAACDGFRPLVTTVLDPALSPELGEPILYTLLHLADDPTTRRFRFRPFLELQAVLGPFTNADSAVVPSSQPEGEALLEVSWCVHGMPALGWMLVPFCVRVCQNQWASTHYPAVSSSPHPPPPHTRNRPAAAPSSSCCGPGPASPSSRATSAKV